MKIKTSEATGAALDWAACMALGMKPEDIYISKLGRHVSLYRRMRDEDGKLDGTYMTGPDLLFSRKWESGGPIIERERIVFDYYNHICDGDDQVHARLSRAKLKPDKSASWYAPKRGPTVLVAAMRCYVASRLGDEVDVPEELLA